MSENHVLASVFALYLIPLVLYSTPILLILFADNEDVPIPICFFAYLIFMQYFGVFDLISFLWNNILWIIFAFLAYFAVGVLVSRAKFYMFIRQDNQIAGFKKAIQKKEEGKFIVDFLANNRLRVTRWVTLWPLILSRMVLVEMYTFVANTLYDYFRVTYAAMANNLINTLKSQMISSSSASDEQNEDDDYDENNIPRDSPSRSTRRSGRTSNQSR